MTDRSSDLSNLRVLVVEDTFLIAEVIRDIVESRGGEVIGPAARVPAALKLAESTPLDGAVLDVNLAGEFCFPIAAALRERGVPFVFLTGYDDAEMMPAPYRAAPRLSKPFDSDRLAQVLAECFRPPA